MSAASEACDVAAGSVDVQLPEPPERPLESDCCGNGCIPCVFDLYEEELALWESECKRLTSGEKGIRDTGQSQTLPLQKDQYSSYTIDSITPESADAVRIRFNLSEDHSLGLTIGQHILIRCQKPNGQVVTRQYTPISPVNVKGFFELIIKIYDNGQMSQLVRLWEAGHKIEARGPIGHLPYSRNKFRRVLMLCVGTGVAPMCQVTHSVLSDEMEDTCFRLVYGAKSYTQLIAKPEIEEWRRFWNFSALFVLSEEPEPPLCLYKYGEEVLRGHIDRDLITAELGDSFGGTFVLVCGTKSFESDVLKILKQIGLPEENVHKF